MVVYTTSFMRIGFLIGLTGQQLILDVVHCFTTEKLMISCSIIRDTRWNSITYFGFKVCCCHLSCLRSIGSGRWNNGTPSLPSSTRFPSFCAGGGNGVQVYSWINGREITATSRFCTRNMTLVSLRRYFHGIRHAGIQYPALRTVLPIKRHTIFQSNRFAFTVIYTTGKIYLYIMYST